MMLDEFEEGVWGENIKNFGLRKAVVLLYVGRTAWAQRNHPVATDTTVTLNTSSLLVKPWMYGNRGDQEVWSRHVQVGKGVSGRNPSLGLGGGWIGV